MNIFFLDMCPIKAARYHCDKHTVKMILEVAQMMSTAHHVYETKQAPYLYKPTHKNHPMSKWVRESMDNYNWAFNHLIALLNEFHKRRGKAHKTGEKLKYLQHNPNLPLKGLTEPPQCMPDEYKVEGDIVTSYRRYYMNDKASFARWEWPNAKVPDWWFDGAYYKANWEAPW